MRFTQFTEDHVHAALDAIGVESVDELFAPVPASLRLKGPLDLPS